MNRRTFVSAVTTLAASCAVAAEESSPPKVRAPRLTPPLVGSQLYGWGQYYEREGTQLSQHLDDTLSLLKDAGYDYAEGSLDVATPEQNTKFAERLRKKGLKPVSLYSGGAFHVLGKATETAERIARASAVCAKAGFVIINVNPDPIGRDKTDAELKIQAEALTELGTELRRMGMQLGIHHHTPELRNGAKEFHSNFALCPAASVGFCYDVHWVYRGGIPPAECLPRYGSRIVSWHLRQSRQQIWWEDLDTGDLDYAAVADFARGHRLPAFYTVELALEPGTQVTRSAAQNHARSRAFVKQVLGV